MSRGRVHGLRADSSKNEVIGRSPASSGKGRSRMGGIRFLRGGQAAPHGNGSKSGALAWLCEPVGLVPLNSSTEAGKSPRQECHNQKIRPRNKDVIRNLCVSRTEHDEDLILRREIIAKPLRISIVGGVVPPTSPPVSGPTFFSRPGGSVLSRSKAIVERRVSVRMVSNLFPARMVSAYLRHLLALQATTGVHQYGGGSGIN